MSAEGNQSSKFVVYGLGELGRLFAGGALRCGLEVVPITRSSNPAQVLADVPSGTPILVGVREDSIASVLRELPEDRKSDVILIQNELFEPKWRSWGIEDPTVAAVWTLVKPSMPRIHGLRTGVFGKHAELFADIHRELGLECKVLENAGELACELVAKFAMILTVNTLGCLKAQSVGAWLEADPVLFGAVARDAVLLGEMHAGRRVDAEAAWSLVKAGAEGLAAMPAAGRTALPRLQRAMADIRSKGVVAPSFQKVAADLGL